MYLREVGRSIVAVHGVLLHVPVTANVVQSSAGLPWHHSDPFDRLLVAQAIELGLHLVTRDAVFSTYGVSVIDA
jgi:PIN domain nuclease of toxin-antitoxin system